MKQMTCIGIGMGNPNTLTVAASTAIADCDLLIGAPRMLAAFSSVPCQTFACCQTDEICRYLLEHPQYQNIGILFSGDVGFYSGAKSLTQAFQQQPFHDYHITHICGVSSLTYFCAQLQIPWDDAKIVSLHGREAAWMNTVTRYKKTFLLTGGAYGVENICKALCEHHLHHVTVHVGSNLSYEEESIISGSPKELAENTYPALSVVLIENPSAQTNQMVTHGLPDETFIRGNVPMTKSEVRCISLSKLQLTKQDIVYDIGAGTGSVAIELALQLPFGTVFAIEKSEEAIKLIQQNKVKFCADHLQIIKGIAPKAFLPLPAPTKAFIGGSCGNLKEILLGLLQKNPHVRIVINAIALETLTLSITLLKELQIPILDVTQASIAKAKEVGNYHMMMGQNPVFIITAQGS